jgi:hypothetical protein
VVVGIHDYSASDLAPERRLEPGPDRNWRNLQGAVNDAKAMYEMLTCTYGFAPDRVRLLLDEEATRQAILNAIDEVLIEPAKKGDHLVFFYAGHGSQRVNSESDEADGKDESLVPADSRLGADDIRDKELRRRFNRAVKRHARLTVVLDSCYSGSGVRGPNGFVPRAVKLDPRDVKDGEDPGPPLEQGGALVLAAAQEFELAQEVSPPGDLPPAEEVWDEDLKVPHGAFTLALLRTLRTAPEGESVAETFARTRAWLRVLRKYQEPVISAKDEVRSEVRNAPLFGDRADQRGGRTVVAAGRVDHDSVEILGGWVNGLTRGSRVKSVEDPEVVLEITETDGLTRSLARVLRPEGRPASEVVKTAQLFEVSGWAVPPGPPLPVRIPEATDDVRRWAAALIRDVEKAGIALSDDPTAEPLPTHVLQWRDGRWRLTGSDGEPHALSAAPASAEVLDHLRRDLSSAPRLFVELPASPELVRQLELGPGTDRDKVEPTADDRLSYLYVLTGRQAGDRLELAWVAPGVRDGDGERSPMPLRSRWRAFDPSQAESVAAAADGLEQDASGLARVHSWLHLEPQGWEPFPYRLALKAEGSGGLVASDSKVVDGERYGLVLRAEAESVKSFVQPHYVYAFSIDSFGACTLLFPLPGQGNVGNHFPANEQAPYPTEIALGPNPLFAVTEPYGTDTYYLLATVEAVPDPWVLNCRGVRDVRGRLTALEELLLQTGSEKRGTDPVYTPESWFVERLFVRSVPANASEN